MKADAAPMLSNRRTQSSSQIPTGRANERAFNRAASLETASRMRALTEGTSGETLSPLSQRGTTTQFPTTYSHWGNDNPKANTVTYSSPVAGSLMRYIQNRSAETRFDLPTENFFTGRHIVNQIKSVQATCLTCVHDTVWIGEKSGALSVWDLQHGEFIDRRPKDPKLLITAIQKVGLHVWVGYSSGLLRVFDTDKLSILKEVKEHAGAIHQIMLAFDGVSVYTASADFTINQWDASNVEAVAGLCGHRGAVRCLASAGGVRLFSGSDDHSIIEWDMAKGKPRFILKGQHRGGIRCLATTSTHLWSGSEDGTVRVWSLLAEGQPNTANAVATRSASGRGPSVATRDDGDDDVNRLPGGSQSVYQRMISLNDCSVPTCVHVIGQPHTSVVTQLHFVGSRMWSGCLGTLFVWNVDTFQLEGQFREHSGHLLCIGAVHQSTVARVWTCGSEGVIKMWNSESQWTTAFRAAQDEQVRRLEQLLQEEAVKEQRMAIAYDDAKEDLRVVANSNVQLRKRIDELTRENRVLTDDLEKMSHGDRHFKVQTLAASNISNDDMDTVEKRLAPLLHKVCQSSAKRQEDLLLSPRDKREKSGGTRVTPFDVQSYEELQRDLEALAHLNGYYKGTNGEADEALGRWKKGDYGFGVAGDGSPLVDGTFSKESDESEMARQHNNLRMELLTLRAQMAELLNKAHGSQRQENGQPMLRSMRSFHRLTTGDGIGADEVPSGATELNVDEITNADLELLMEVKRRAMEALHNSPSNASRMGQPDSEEPSGPNIRPITLCLTRPRRSGTEGGSTSDTKSGRIIPSMGPIPISEQMSVEDKAVLAMMRLKYGPMTGESGVFHASDAKAPSSMQRTSSGLSQLSWGHGSKKAAAAAKKGFDRPPPSAHLIAVMPPQEVVETGNAAAKIQRYANDPHALAAVTPLPSSAILGYLTTEELATDELKALNRIVVDARKRRSKNPSAEREEGNTSHSISPERFLEEPSTSGRFDETLLESPIFFRKPPGNPLAMTELNSEATRLYNLQTIVDRTVPIGLLLPPLHTLPIDDLETVYLIYKRHRGVGSMAAIAEKLRLLNKTDDDLKNLGDKLAPSSYPPGLAKSCDALRVDTELSLASLLQENERMNQKLSALKKEIRDANEVLDKHPEIQRCYGVNDTSYMTPLESRLMALGDALEGVQRGGVGEGSLRGGGMEHAHHGLLGRVVNSMQDLCTTGVIEGTDEGVKPPSLDESMNENMMRDVITGKTDEALLKNRAKAKKRLALFSEITDTPLIRRQLGSGEEADGVSGSDHFNAEDKDKIRAAVAEALITFRKNEASLAKKSVEASLGVDESRIRHPEPLGSEEHAIADAARLAAAAQILGERLQESRQRNRHLSLEVESERQSTHTNMAQNRQQSSGNVSKLKQQIEDLRNALEEQREEGGNNEKLAAEIEAEKLRLDEMYKQWRRRDYIAERKFHDERRLARAAARLRNPALAAYAKSLVPPNDQEGSALKPTSGALEDVDLNASESDFGRENSQPNFAERFSSVENVNRAQRADELLEKARVNVDSELGRGKPEDEPDLDKCLAMADAHNQNYYSFLNHYPIQGVTLDDILPQVVEDHTFNRYDKLRRTLLKQRADEVRAFGKKRGGAVQASLDNDFQLRFTTAGRSGGAPLPYEEQEQLRRATKGIDQNIENTEKEMNDVCREIAENYRRGRLQGFQENNNTLEDDDDDHGGKMSLRGKAAIRDSGILRSDLKKAQQAFHKLQGQIARTNAELQRQEEARSEEAVRQKIIAAGRSSPAPQQGTSLIEKRNEREQAIAVRALLQYAKDELRALRTRDIGLPSSLSPRSSSAGRAYDPKDGTDPVTRAFFEPIDEAVQKVLDELTQTEIVLGLRRERALTAQVERLQQDLHREQMRTNASSKDYLAAEQDRSRSEHAALEKYVRANQKLEDENRALASELRARKGELADALAELNDANRALMNTGGLRPDEYEEREPEEYEQGRIQTGGYDPTGAGARDSIVSEAQSESRAGAGQVGKGVGFMQRDVTPRKTATGGYQGQDSASEDSHDDGNRGVVRRQSTVGELNASSRGGDPAVEEALRKRLANTEAMLAEVTAAMRRMQQELDKKRDDEAKERFDRLKTVGSDENEDQAPSKGGKGKQQDPMIANADDDDDEYVDFGDVTNNVIDIDEEEEEPAPAGKRVISPKSGESKKKFVVKVDQKVQTEPVEAPSRIRSKGGVSFNDKLDVRQADTYTDEDDDDADQAPLRNMNKDELCDEIQRLEEQLAHRDDDVAQLNKLLEEARNDSVDLEAEIERLKEQLDEAEKQNAEHELQKTATLLRSGSMDADPRAATLSGRRSSSSLPRDKQLEDLERRNQQLQEARDRLEDQVAQLQEAQEEAEERENALRRSLQPAHSDDASGLEQSPMGSFSNKAGQKLEKDNAELRRRLAEKQEELDNLREKLDALQSMANRKTTPPPPSRAQNAAAAIAERRSLALQPSTLDSGVGGQGGSGSGNNSPSRSSQKSVPRGGSTLKKRDLSPPQTADFSGRTREELERDLANALAAADRANALLEAERKKTLANSQRLLDSEKQEAERRKRYEANRDAEIEKLHGIIAALEKQYPQGKSRQGSKFGDPSTMGQPASRRGTDGTDDKQRMQGQYRNLERQLINDAPHVDANVAKHRKNLKSQKSPDLDAIAETMDNLNEREKKWRELAKMSRQLQQDENPQESDLVAKLRTLAYLFETRPILIRALYELFKILQKTLKLNTQHRKAVDTRPLSRAEAVAQHVTLREEVETAKEGNRWIIANLFTDAELYHIGASPSQFVPDGRRPTWRDIVLPEKYQRLIAAAQDQQISSTGHRENSPESTRR